MRCRRPAQLSEVHAGPRESEAHWLPTPAYCWRLVDGRPKLDCWKNTRQIPPTSPEREFRQRGVPSGLANEIYLDVYARPASFEHGVENLQRRLFDAYAAEVARVDQNHDGIISAVEGDIEGHEHETRAPAPQASRQLAWLDDGKAEAEAELLQ